MTDKHPGVKNDPGSDADAVAERHERPDRDVRSDLNVLSTGDVGGDTASHIRSDEELLDDPRERVLRIGGHDLGARQTGQFAADYERGCSGLGRRREVPVVLDVRQIALAGFGKARYAGHGHVGRADEPPFYGPGDVAQCVRLSLLTGRHLAYPFFPGFGRGDGGLVAAGWAGTTFPSMYAATLATVTSVARSLS